VTVAEPTAAAARHSTSTGRKHRLVVLEHAAVRVVRSAARGHLALAAERSGHVAQVYSAACG
jgi:hypothetical protein